jgi:hypothetical protein
MAEPAGRGARVSFHASPYRHRFHGQFLGVSASLSLPACLARGTQVPG